MQGNTNRETTSSAWREIEKSDFAVLRFLKDVPKSLVISVMIKREKETRGHGFEEQVDFQNGFSCYN